MFSVYFKQSRCFVLHESLPSFKELIKYLETLTLYWMFCQNFEWKYFFFPFRFISPGGEESTEDIVQQVVEKALLNAKAEELRSQVNGVKKLFTSLAHSVANFRETGNITYDQALAFYDQGFTVTFLINMKTRDYYATTKSG